MTSFAGRATNDLVQIASFGGGFTLDAAGRSTDDLVKIASFARDKGCRIILRGMNGRSTNDLVKIASSGNGCVHFEG
ncbi:hypothetical protein FJ960_01825 [Mesorhizobium sp. B2-3-11]|uniref:hypothetical protein n=1 Tax=Mesorhizobium sp. B2-3-11 TaxID=2589953 RepID=UPI00112CF12C|nr:hypothetical protein [Mesorhizobium sp. B2-3-11]TPM11507.1 hypothetical protein FJ960_01825 [Mesorhizobium sp. B2-3-11]